MTDEAAPPFLLHIEPDNPIDLRELNGTLGGLARQYAVFSKDSSAQNLSNRLLVSGVKPGSIDLFMTPEDISNAALIARGSVADFPTMGKVGLEFIRYLKGLFDTIEASKPGKAPEGITIRDCEDVISINRPIATRGGTQLFQSHQGNVYNTIIKIEQPRARTLTEKAVQTKALLDEKSRETHRQVALEWAQVERGKALTEGARSPDKAVIHTIDEDARPVFFQEDLAYLKNDILSTPDENLYQQIYFVDVEVIRRPKDNRVIQYRIIGYHGKDEL